MKNRKVAGLHEAFAEETAAANQPELPMQFLSEEARLAAGESTDSGWRVTLNRLIARLPLRQMMNLKVGDTLKGSYYTLKGSLYLCSIGASGSCH